MKLKAFISVVLMICFSLASCAPNEVSSSALPTPTPSQPAASSEPTAAPSEVSNPSINSGVANLPVVSPLTDDEKNTLGSLRQVGDLPLYVMEHRGDYDPTLLGTLNKAFGISPACSTFAVKGSADTIFARNHDFFDTSALLLYNKPTNGYASISLVDLTHIGYPDGQDLTELPSEQLSRLLYAPYLPIDGMNECGLAIGIMTVPQASHLSKDAPKVFFLSASREILDQAKNTAEAISILENYQVEFSALPAHFLIADKSGDMAVVEFVRGKMQVLRSTANWQAATNFVLCDSEGLLDTFRNSGTKDRKSMIDDSFWRYTVIEDTLSTAEDGLGFSDAMGLLKTVSTLERDNVINNTQWSVIYGLVSARVELAVHMDYDKVVSFQFDKDGNLFEQISVQ